MTYYKNSYSNQRLRAPKPLTVGFYPNPKPEVRTEKEGGSQSIRAADTPAVRVDKEPRTVSGYVIMWNVYSQDLGGFYEIFRPGAFRWSLAHRDCYFCLNHEGRNLGSLKSGALELREDRKGLYFKMDLSGAGGFGEDTYDLVKDGVIKKMSFDFRAEIERWYTQGYNRIREVLDADLNHISPVVDPAFPQGYIRADSAVRPLAELKKELLELERSLR